MSEPLQLALGPIYFHWSPEQIVGFYSQIAHGAPIDRVYLGEVVCGKREPLVREALAAAAAELRNAGKEVVWSGPALPMTPRDRAAIPSFGTGELVEVNDFSGLSRHDGSSPFVAGPFLNIYNEAAAAELVSRGCTRLCANVELSLAAVDQIARTHRGLEIEIFAFGRLPLALSGRCYHARLHGLGKDACQFICRRDPDGLGVETLEGQPFLAMNGVQTLSHAVQLADLDPDRLRSCGVTALRLSPHACDMPAVARSFRAFLNGGLSRAQLRAAVKAVEPPGRLVNGYLAGSPGHMWRPEL